MLSERNISPASRGRRSNDNDRSDRLGITFYYMAESASGQDETNPTFWLATRAGTIVPSYPLGISRVDPSSKSSFLATY